MFVAVILVIYYAIITIHFYGNDLKKKLFAAQGQHGLQNESEDLFPVAHLLMEELREHFQSPLSREACVHTLQKLLQKYPKLKGTAFQQAINNKINVLVHQTCDLELGEEELQLVWSSERPG